MLKLINEAKIEGLELGHGRSKTVGECDTYAEIEWLVMIERGNLAQSRAPVSDSSRLLDSSSTMQRNNDGRDAVSVKYLSHWTTLIRGCYQQENPTSYFKLHRLSEILTTFIL
jgi:hypothetical protein